MGLSTLAVVSLTKRCKKIIRYFIFLVSSGLLPVIRNSVITYFGLGLVVAPEIYNPWLVRRTWSKDINKNNNKIKNTGLSWKILN